jgi:hypothetical protein
MYFQAYPNFAIQANNQVLGWLLQHPHAGKVFSSQLFFLEILYELPFIVVLVLLYRANLG